MDIKKIKTLGDLKKSGYTPKSIKEEVRDNLINTIQNEDTNYEGVLGFEDTVLPDLERALLSKHNILLLGLRGQAKTRIARLTTNLLDEYIPIIEGSELNEDPMQPITKYAQDIIKEKGDATPIKWVHRNERYVEKLATPDVSIADLIGDVDPIKAATLKLPYSDPRVIHYGLIPRSHRSIFVLNELPDLQARIQVSLFNILQEGDIQIRGFKLRLPLDILFVFTANPEDYTNRGSIITPLKDRIESQILTHYPKTIEIAKSITAQEISTSQAIQDAIEIPELIRDLLEMTVFEARKSEFIDENSGVSARLSITALENLYSTVERRMLKNNEKTAVARVSDFWGVIPSITGKVELVYEGEQEGHYNVALHLISSALKKLFLEYFEDPDKAMQKEERDPYRGARAWFSEGNEIDLLNDASAKDYVKILDSIPSLDKILDSLNIEDHRSLFKEFLLHGMTEFEVISKEFLIRSINFKDPLANMFNNLARD
ncbi:MAG: magnesium chelatase [Saprospiraceae bacterium]|nr:magnesium chelatase [Saprospiraceae bacterium]